MLLRSPRRDVAVDRRAGLVPDLGRGPEARPQRVHAARSARRSPTATSTPRPRCSARATSRATRRSRPISRPRARRSGSSASKRWLAGARDARRRAPRAGGRSRVHARARSEGRARRPARRALAALGASRAQRSCSSTTSASLAAAYAMLLDARVELHRRTGRPSNVLALQEQDGVAEALGLADGDALMAGIAAAARAIAWTSDDAWRRVRSSLRGPLGRVGERDRVLGDGVDRCATARCTSTPTPIRPTIRCSRCAPARLAAEHETVIDRDSLERLAERGAGAARPVAARGARAPRRACCSPGSDAIPVIEALDHRGIWARILPEWEPVRSRPQRNAYHRFTVDRHLLETVANAAALARPRRPARPARAGRAAARPRQGRRPATTPRSASSSRAGSARGSAFPTPTSTCSPSSSRTTCCCRRSRCAATSTIPTTIAARRRARLVGRVAAAARRAHRSRLARDRPGGVGPGEGAARRAARRPRRARAGRRRHGDGIVRARVPDARSSARCSRSRARRSRPSGELLTVMTDDRPGIFSKVAGVLAFHGLDVVSASAYSSRRPRARRSSACPTRSATRDAVAAGRARPRCARSTAGSRCRPASPTRARRTPAGSARRGAPPTATVRFDNDASEPRPSSTCTPPTASACCTASPARSPSSTSTSARRGCRRSARRWSTRSTSSTDQGDKITDPRHDRRDRTGDRVRVERGLIAPRPFGNDPKPIVYEERVREGARAPADRARADAGVDRARGPAASS